jgi:acyl-CoA reductase-like NAD-dependent aldehyde dehydrogenase
VVVKDRSDALVASFFETLADEHPAFARAARAQAWSGGADPDEDALLGAADVVVAFGRDEALRAIRARCGAQARFVPFGHRASAGRLTRAEVAALDDGLAERIARDALLYDGEGCLSLHVLFAQAEGTALERLGELLAAACERVAVEFPAAPLAPERAAALAAYRNLAAFRAATGRGAVYRGGGATVAVDVPRDDPPPFLPRVLPVVAVRSDDEIAEYVATHRLPLQALGVAAADNTALALAARLGAVRVAPLGTLQDPPPGGHHGGQPRIADFVRWLDRE